MILMHVVGLTVDEKTKTPIVLLQDESGYELLPIWVGAMEAMAISLGLSGKTLPRPLTHDLLLETLLACNAMLMSVAITDIRNNTYYATLYINHGSDNLAVDCRPSDAIALALRMSVPIHVSPVVVEKAAAARILVNDAHSPLTSPPADIATDMLRHAAQNLWNQRNKGEEKNPTDTFRPHVATVKNPAQTNAQKNSPEKNIEDEEQRMAALLRNLEPESSRKM